MKVLVVGSGGREHVLIWKIKQSPHVSEIFCAPGNGGIASDAKCVDIQATDIDGLLKFAKDQGVEFTIVGPEAPLAAGIVDAFEAKKMKIFGPSKAAAQLEGSKVFAKQFMKRCNIPTASFKVFDDLNKAKSFLTKAEHPIVIKADGLAAGKGVIICNDLNQSMEAVDQIMQDKVFKEAGNQIVIEECLIGEEASILAISDGENYCILDASQDHKRIFDDDLGPNTGGMGAYCPAPVITEELKTQIEARVIEPAIRGMRREGIPFKGVLYAGLILTQDGPMTLEFNVRFGDPEAQAVLPRLKNDLMELMAASCDGRLNDIELIWDKRTCICVVMSSGGYPGAYKTGYEIKGLEQFATPTADTLVFHAGTKQENGKIVTSGGRVLGVTSFGQTIEKAIENVYHSVEKITFERCFFRRDIGTKALLAGGPTPSSGKR